MNNLSAALTIISGMITPAVLVLATGSLLLTTSQRLNRTLERIRKIYEDLEGLWQKNFSDYEERKNNLKDLVSILAKRSRLLQKAMSVLYFALTIFVSTSVLIGIIQIAGFRYPWVAAFLTLTGTTFLLYSCLLLISESTLALRFVRREMSVIQLMIARLK